MTTSKKNASTSKVVLKQVDGKAKPNWITNAERCGRVFRAVEVQTVTTRVATQWESTCEVCGKSYLVNQATVTTVTCPDHRGKIRNDKEWRNRKK
jgi:hypothetical protein